MDCSRLKNAVYWLAVSLVQVASVIYTGCETTPEPGNRALIRVINASINAKAIDVKLATPPRPLS